MSTSERYGGKIVRDKKVRGITPSREPYVRHTGKVPKE